MDLGQSAAAGDVHWTTDQSAAIRHLESDLLVSAAAGSGKTAVLAERCAWLVCDADSPCDVDQLLVVTFTEAAAAEMKQRIAAALRRRMERPFSGEDAPEMKKRARLSRQLALLDRAQISTLHAFCATLIRRHHAALGLDPGFKILDKDEAGLLKREVVKEVFEYGYEVSGGAHQQEDSFPLRGFSEFVDDYGEGRDQALMDQVVAAYELLQSVVDPDEWRTTALRRLVEGAERPLDQSELGRELIALLRGYLESLQRQCAQAGKIISKMPGFGAYTTLLREWYRIIQHWCGLASVSLAPSSAHTADDDGKSGAAEDAHWLSALAEEIQGVDWPKLPSMKKDMVGKETAKGLMDDLKKNLKEGPLSQLLKFSQDQWQSGLRDILPHAELFLNLVDEFSGRYAQAKRSRGGLDFSDLERLALKVLTGQNAKDQTASPASADCRRRFRHVLVDEYQDINQVQDVILSAVAGEALPDGQKHLSNKSKESSPRHAGRNLPTLFYVGDVKQSIYRFRLAEPRRFLERQTRFRTAPPGLGAVIDLQKNFRSRGPLLGAINAVFQQLMTAEAAEIEYDQSHHLHPGADYSQAAGPEFFPGAPIEMHLLPQTIGSSDSYDEESSELPEAKENQDDADRSEREAMLIAQRIHQMTAPPRENSAGQNQPIVQNEKSCPMRILDKNGAPRPVEYRDIVILLRSLKHKAGEYASMLRQSGIPVHTDSGGDFFQSTEIRDMMALLRVLDNHLQDVPMAALLRSRLVFGGAQSPTFSEADLAAIRIAFMHEADPPAFCESVLRYAAERNDTLSAQLRETLARIARWRELAQRRPLAELIWTIYQETGFLAYVAGLHNGRQRVANLLHLHRRAQQFGSFARQGLFRFLRFLDQLAQRLEEPSIASAAENAVRIMSIHSAKGLEFPIVILADLGKKFNLSDAQGSILLDRHEGLGLKVADTKLQVRYPSLAWTIIAERTRRHTLAEEMRLLYVAMTRAREHLICVGTTAKDAPEDMGANDGSPLPPETILSARAPLDWLIPVTSRLANQNAFNVTLWTPEDMAQWPTPRQLRNAMDQWQRDRAELKPLQPPAPTDSAAQEVIQRLSVPYAFEPFTRIAAAVAVTSKTDASKPPNEIPQMLRAVMDEQQAMERGSAYHEVLRFLDFSRPCDEPNLCEQIEAMVARHQLSRQQADQVMVADLCWLMQTEPGGLLLQHAHRLWRELPFTWATAPAGLSPADPLDRQIVRGRLDVLIPTSEGLVLLDYKTDRVQAERLQQRLEEYRPQLKLYARALAEATRQKVLGAHLIFHHARQVCPL
jgi:ATP-dependent helicase/nuclease subunit A